MNINHYFNPGRFWKLLRLELSKNARTVSMAFIVTFGLLLCVAILWIIFDKEMKAFRHDQNYAFSLIVSGIVLSSFAFNDLGNPARRHIYLMLPSSTLEKLFCMLLLSSLGWVFLFTIAYTAYTLAATPVIELLSRNVHLTPFNPFDEYVLTSIKYYIVLQSIFLLGAATFRGYPLLKTTTAIILVVLVIGAILYFSLIDVFLTDHDCDGSHCELLDVIGLHAVWSMAKLFFWWILAPMCWVLAYVGLKEQEV